MYVLFIGRQSLGLAVTISGKGLPEPFLDFSRGDATRESPRRFSLLEYLVSQGRLWHR